MSLADSARTPAGSGSAAGASAESSKHARIVRAGTVNTLIALSISPIKRSKKSCLRLSMHTLYYGRVAHAGGAGFYGRGSVNSRAFRQTTLNSHVHRIFEA